MLAEGMDSATAKTGERLDSLLDRLFLEHPYPSVLLKPKKQHAHVAIVQNARTEGLLKGSRHGPKHAHAVQHQIPLKETFKLRRESQGSNDVLKIRERRS